MRIIFIDCKLYKHMVIFLLLWWWLFCDEFLTTPYPLITDYANNYLIHGTLFIIVVVIILLSSFCLCFVYMLTGIRFCLVWW